MRPTIIIGGIDTGVPNRGLGSGCTMADTIVSIKAASGNHGSFVSAIAHLTNQWKDAGLIAGSQKGAIQSAAAKCRTNRQPLRSRLRTTPESSVPHLR